MILAPTYKEEQARIQALHALNILDTPADFRYDSITAFAAEMFDVPICFIGFIDSDRQWFKSEVGMKVKETLREISFCAHSICSIKSRLPQERVYEVPNTQNDARFFDNPLVTGSPNIYSYLSYVLQSDCGENIGTFCIIDTKERNYTDSDYEKVILLGNIIENILHGRHYLSGIAGEIH